VITIKDAIEWQRRNGVTMDGHQTIALVDFANLEQVDQLAWDRFAAAALIGLTGTMFGDETPDPQGYTELAARMATEMMKHREKEKTK